MLVGSLVALVTPMYQDGSVDYGRFDQLLRLHMASDTAAVVIAGTTGEAATLTIGEHAQLISAAVDICGARLPVVAGIGANSTSEAIDLAAMAKASGAYASLTVAPYYVRPNQSGMIAHFEAVACATSFPQILYNIPGRTGTDMHDSTILTLARNPHIVGLKDATSDLARAAEIISAAPPHFACYSGDDATALAYMLLGGHGTISVAANIVPQAIARLCQFALSGKVEAARSLNKSLLAIYRALSLDSNPIPVKYALASFKLIENVLRLPMVSLSEEHGAQLRSAFEGAVDHLDEISRLAQAMETRVS